MHLKIQIEKLTKNRTRWHAASIDLCFVQGVEGNKSSQLTYKGALVLPTLGWGLIDFFIEATTVITAQAAD